MRKILFTITFCMLAMSLQAKTTYIPTYDNRLILIDKGEVDSLTNKAHLHNPPHTRSNSGEL